jgi:hypothetical protein
MTEQKTDAAHRNTVEQLVGLAGAVRELFAVLDAHEIDTFDCDRAGVVHCDCLDLARKKVESMMPNIPIHVKTHC